MDTQVIAENMAKWRTHLQRYMDEQGLTSKDILMATGMHYKTIKQWREESMDSLDATLVESVCRKLGVHWHDFVYMEEAPEQES